MDNTKAGSNAARLQLIVPTELQPTLQELYAHIGFSVAATKARFVRPSIPASPKTIIVFRDRQFFGNEHADIVIEQVLRMRPSEYLERVEALTLVGCGFVKHELYQDGHVCKHVERESHLDCAHSTARKTLETAIGLVLNDSDGEDDIINQRFEATFVAADHAIAALDRAVAEVCEGLPRHDSMALLTRETGYFPSTEPGSDADLRKMRATLAPRLRERQAHRLYRAPGVVQPRARRGAAPRRLVDMLLEQTRRRVRQHPCLVVHPSTSSTALP